MDSSTATLLVFLAGAASGVFIMFTRPKRVQQEVMLDEKPPQQQLTPRVTLNSVWYQIHELRRELKMDLSGIRNAVGKLTADVRANHQALVDLVNRALQTDPTDTAAVQEIQAQLDQLTMELEATTAQANSAVPLPTVAEGGVQPNFPTPAPPTQAELDEADRLASTQSGPVAAPPTAAELSTPNLKAGFPAPPAPGELDDNA